VWNQRQYDVADELLSSDFVIHSSAPGNDIQGPEVAKQFFATLHAGFPDLCFTVEDQIAEGDRVVTRWIAQGTHRGEFQGIPATGNQIRLTGIDIDRIAGGKVVECWTNVDEFGLMQQLGVVPTPEPVG
jgi:steroid delta-isomerase-like uncharacterized protein